MKPQMKRLKVMTIFGTRPEAIKMAPIVKALEMEEKIDHILCVTAQHRQMLDQVLEIFSLEPAYDLDIFSPGQSLSQITSRALTGLESVIEKEMPDVVLVQGDTSTVFAGALAAFYHKVKVGHVEAGLRSHDMYSPYPEEANRKLTGVLTDFHFAPTTVSRQNLLAEGIDEAKIFVTGNTVIDALLSVIEDKFTFSDSLLNEIDYKDRRVILLTSHRSENIGQPMERIFSGIRQIVEEQADVEVIFPMHLNPKVREIAYRHLSDHGRIHLIEPLDYLTLANLLAKVDLVVTDSGGIQEEAPALGKPVLVVREETERPEGIAAGTAKLIGTDRELLVGELRTLLTQPAAYEAMANAVNPYGEGNAAEQIVEILLKQN
ncbi:UDP-N-acetylglucosamine 2-epimerase (non-hydrolyzing) [Gottschalkiaceae bacterium SANA]|nr:UDP-N-acetylglucosamine 2-epimerase (non-hydrolyzing) [Gottschalkiaceae bacterium SANA]